MPGHILMVEEDCLLANIFSRYLKANNYAVTTATSEEEALLFLQRRHFDLVLSEISLDGWERNGFTILAACKAIHPQTKVILCADDRAYATVSSAFNRGADGLLAKPFPLHELGKQICLCLGEQRHHLALPRDSRLQVGLWHGAAA